VISSSNRRGEDNLLSKSKLGVLAIITLFLLSFSLSFALVRAQSSPYTTEKTTNVTIGSNGTFNATESDVGASYQILGTPGATGTVTASVYNGDPQPTATVPNGTSLTSFIVVTIKMNANDFSSATITLSYTDSMVQNIKQPYKVYKYNADSNSYTALPSTVDTSAKTITVTLSSLSDPLLAIGGAKTATSGNLLSTGIIVVAIVIVIVLVTVAIFYLMRSRHGSSSEPLVSGTEMEKPSPAPLQVQTKMAKCPQCGKEVVPKKTWTMAGKPNKEGRRTELTIGLYECCDKTFRETIDKKKI
jgi:hypothetical protein